VIIDIFPTSRRTHYNGDLTRTVVVGEISDEVRRMHAAVVQALDAGIESIVPGVPGKEPHLNVCQVLIDRGFGTRTTGYEGPDGVAKMNTALATASGLMCTKNRPSGTRPTIPWRRVTWSLSSRVSTWSGWVGFGSRTPAW
jgi:hypothetical protein